MNEQQIMTHARIDSPRQSFFRFYCLRRRLSPFAIALFCSVGHNTALSAAEIEAKSSQTLLDEIQQVQSDLDRQRRELASKSETDTVDKQQRWQALAERFVFSKNSEKILQFQKAKALLQQNRKDDAQVLLQDVATDYKKISEDFALIGKTIEAEDRAEQTRKDSKMYFMMRVRSKLPPKTLKAYGIMELAAQQRDKGNFAEALDLWGQAEIMVRESFNEHIAGMTEWREQSAKKAEAENSDIRDNVEKILAGYFVAIPAGTFLMGSKDGGLDEAPQHKVHIPAFRLGKTEVTFALYDLCVASTRCYAVPNDHGWGRNDRPVTNVSYRDITQQFLPWLNAVTGREYRLPTEAEWEYAARAGSTTEYTWGDNLTCSMARFDGGSTSVCNAREGKNRGTVPVMSYKANAFGLYDMHGNLWEWVDDCWNPNYENAPADGSAWLTGNCAVKVLRGGSWDYHKSGLRSANRYSFSQKVRRPNYGFRLAHDK